MLMQEISPWKLETSFLPDGDLSPPLQSPLRHFFILFSALCLGPR